MRFLHAKQDWAQKLDNCLVISFEAVFQLALLAEWASALQGPACASEREREREGERERERGNPSMFVRG